jgi:hypothetical protein
MNFWSWLTRRRDDHGWPAYVINGRIRTSTAGLIVAFIAISWLHNTYQPPPPVPTAPETAVVPPGFVPDPAYTWVPRTNVQTRPKTTEPTTTESTTTTETTSPTETTSTDSSETPSTTGTSPSGTPTSTTTVPNRSGMPTAPPTTAVVPGPGPSPTSPQPPQ